jgi:nucleotide-binding universal stress UspA family protein
MGTPARSEEVTPVGTKILVPLDGSELAATAVGYAEQVARALGWSVVLFTVVHRDESHHSLYRVSTPMIEAPAAVWTRWEGQLQAEDADLQHELTAALDDMTEPARHLSAAGVQVEREAGVGNTQDVLVRRAEHDDVAMIVMASHGRTGLARIFRGSIASGVVGHTNRAVLVVRPFRDPEHRVDLEHAERLPPEQADAVRRAVQAIAG